MTTYELLDKGGVVAWILLGMSTLAVAITAGKCWQYLLWRLRGVAHPAHPVSQLRAAAGST